MSSHVTPTQTLDEIAAQSREHLEQVLRVDSSSDEDSPSIPSTPGQAELAGDLEGFFEGMGASVELDEHSNVIASWPGRGVGVGKAPLALLVHLDTARGTHPVDGLTCVEGWDGTTLALSANEHLQVNVANYPSLQRYVGHDVLHGPGDAPFGLDDKLGLAHVMTLAWLLHTNPAIPHPPLVIVARPDEEIGQMEALVGVADALAARGVRVGYTIDGLEPYEINIENFNARRGAVRFESKPARTGAGGKLVRALIGGVNTHGATAHAEGHRPATRLVAEAWHLLKERGAHGITPIYFTSDPERDCDAVVDFHCASNEAQHALIDALEAVVEPHATRGASLTVSFFGHNDEPDGAVVELLEWIHTFLTSAPGFTLSAEDSFGHDGYSQPYRALPVEGGVQLDVRLRDFSRPGLDARANHLRTQAAGRPVEIVHQYINMGPRLADHPELVAWAREAAHACGVEAPVLPIRGGTGVDPFLERGTAIANLGTGYFAPESEKELTSLQYMAGHATWLVHLVQIIAHKAPAEA